MNRKTIKSGTRGVHITLPIRLLEEFDNVLGFKDSRSGRIALLMSNYMNRQDDNLDLMTSLEILERFQYRFKKDSSEDILVQALIKLLS
tara:strand:- start:936 stop:1202 length:267 start_codon:yes stop_codon:yes gene_type:complete